MNALPIANTDRRTTEHSTSDSLGNISWIQKAALQHIQNRIAQDAVYKAFPCIISTASNKRKVEYEARYNPGCAVIKLAFYSVAQKTSSDDVFLCVLWHPMSLFTPRQC